MNYDVILADPPWFYNNRKAGAERKNKTRFGGGAMKHYPLMRDDELLSLAETVKGWAGKNCALFLWCTCPRLDFGITLLEEWGFRYCTIAFVWVKRSSAHRLIKNPGFYTASNIELVLLGVRGKMRPTKPMIQQVVEARRGAHSVKPPDVQARIEQMYPGRRYLEMFARRARPGWDGWGAEFKAERVTRLASNDLPRLPLIP